MDGRLNPRNKATFPNSVGLKRVFEKLRFGDRLVWTVGLTGEIKLRFTAPFNNMRTLKFKDQPTNTFLAAVNQMCRRLLPASDNCRARRNQFREHSRKLGGATELLIDGSEKRICLLSFEF